MKNPPIKPQPGPTLASIFSLFVSLRYPLVPLAGLLLFHFIDLTTYWWSGFFSYVFSGGELKKMFSPQRAPPSTGHIQVYYMIIQ